MIISAKKTKVKKQLNAIIKALEELRDEYEPKAIAYHTRYHSAPISRIPFLNRIIPWLFPDAAQQAQFHSAIIDELIYFNGLQEAMKQDTGHVLYLSDEDVFNIDYAMREYVQD